MKMGKQKVYILNDQRYEKTFGFYQQIPIPKQIGLMFLLLPEQKWKN
jgi:hypothetical protein